MSRIDESRPFVPVRIAVLTVSDTRTPADDRSGDASRRTGTSTVEIPVRYDGQDLSAVAARWGVDEDEVTPTATLRGNADVPYPNGVPSVSPSWTMISSMGMPSSSETICAIVVSCPCP